MIGQLLDQCTARVCLKKIKVLKDLGLGELSGAYLNGHYQQMERIGKENHFVCLMTNKRARFLGICGSGIHLGSGAGRKLVSWRIEIRL